MFPPGLPNGNAPSAPRAAGERGPLPWSWLLAHVIGGYARQHPLRVAVQVLAIAIGVALGYAVHLINASALAEFSSAVRQVTGQADASVTGAREGFDETLYARVAADPAVALASPVLELELPLVEPARLRGRSLTLVGVDLFRVGALAPQWIGEPMGDGDRRFALLDDGLFLSPAALQALGLQPGDTLTVQVGGRTQPLRVAGRLPAAREGHVVAAMDLGFAQWRLDRLGLLSRIDLQLTAGASLAELAPRLALPPGVALQPADAAAQRASNLSRAYRVNLNVLALVALFTGAFLVYSLQAQAVLARRTQLAFLRVIGTTRRAVVATPGYLARFGEPKTPDDLRRHQCVLYSRLATGSSWPLVGKDGPIAVPVQGRVRMNNTEGVRAAVLEGLGIGLVPLWHFVDREIARGKLKVLLAAYAPPPHPINAVYLSRRHTAPKIRAMIDYLAAEFASDPLLRIK